MHSRTNRVCSLAWLSVCLSLVLPADQIMAEPPSQATATDKDVHNVLEYAFDDDRVSGDLVAPLGEVLTVRSKGEKSSLVRARRSFIDKLMRAVENL